MSFAGKNILVTGATGLVGANLIPALIERGARVRATSHRKSPVRPLKDVEYFPCDLMQDGDCGRAVIGQHCIFHCAARGASAARFQSAEGLEFLENFFMDARLLAAAQRAGVEKFLWLGSTTAYPPTGNQPTVEEDLFLGEPFEKYYAVGWCKRFTEVLCRIHSKQPGGKCGIIVLRPSAIYGPGDDFDLVSAHVVPELVRKVVERRNPLEVWGTGEEKRDLVFVSDVVEALLLAAERNEDYMAFNIGAGQSHSIREVVETLVKLDGYTEARIQFDPTKPTTLPVRYVNVQRAANQLGWQPRTCLVQGLRQTLEWYRRHRDTKGAHQG